MHGSLGVPLSTQGKRRGGPSRIKVQVDTPLSVSLSLLYTCLLFRDAAVEMLMEMKQSGWEPTELAYIQVLKTIRGTKVRLLGNRCLSLKSEM